MLGYNNPPDFDSIDWIALARLKGFNIHIPGEPIVLRMASDVEREALAIHYTDILRDNPRLSMEYVTDDLNNRIIQGEITSLDKAHIKMICRKLL